MKLGEYIKFKNGKKKPKEIGKIPVYGGNGVLGYTNKVNTEKNNLIIGRVGAYCGCVYKSDDECWVSDNAILGQVKDNADYDFMYYLLNSLNLNNYHIGSSQPLMTQEILNNLKVDVPEYRVQVKIGKILSKVDDKIILNNQANDNLLEIINCLYKESFTNIQNIKRADEIANITIGKTPPRNIKECFSNEDKDIKWISISDLGKCGTFIFDTNERLTLDAVEKYNVKIIPKETLILSFKLTVGRVAITTEDMATNEAIAHFNLYDNKMKYYLYSYLKNFDYEKLGSTSSIATAVNSKIIKAMPIKIPDEETLKEYNEKVIPMFKKIKSNEMENKTLEQLRDTLLPKLMNGEIDLDKIEI